MLIFNLKMKIYLLTMNTLSINNPVNPLILIILILTIVDHLEGNLQKIKQKKLIEQQTARDDFWAKRDAERKQKDNK